MDTTSPEARDYSEKFIRKAVTKCKKGYAKASAELGIEPEILQKWCNNHNKPSSQKPTKTATPSRILKSIENIGVKKTAKEYEIPEKILRPWFEELKEQEANSPENKEEIDRIKLKLRQKVSIHKTQQNSPAAISHAKTKDQKKGKGGTKNQNSDELYTPYKGFKLEQHSSPQEKNRRTLPPRILINAEETDDTEEEETDIPQQYNCPNIDSDTDSDSDAGISISFPVKIATQQTVGLQSERRDSTSKSPHNSEKEEEQDPKSKSTPPGEVTSPLGNGAGNRSPTKGAEQSPTTIPETPPRPYLLPTPHISPVKNNTPSLEGQQTTPESTTSNQITKENEKEEKEEGSNDSNNEKTSPEEEFALLEEEDIKKLSNKELYTLLHDQLELLSTTTTTDRNIIYNLKQALITAEERQAKTTKKLQEKSAQLDYATTTILQKLPQQTTQSTNEAQTSHRPHLLIQPLNKNITTKQIKEDLEVIGINNNLKATTINSYSDVIKISCKNEKEANNISKVLRNDPYIKENALVECRQSKKQKIMIHNIPDHLTEQQIKKAISHEITINDTTTLTRIRTFRSRHRHKLHWAFNIEDQAANRLLQLKKICINLSTCHIHPFHTPTRCYKCQQFGHRGMSCKYASYCAICAGKHRTGECKEEENVRCINCAIANKDGKQHDVYHMASSTKCPSFREEAKRLQEEYANRNRR